MYITPRYRYKIQTILKTVVRKPLALAIMLTPALLAPALALAHAYSESVLHSFTGINGDGASPGGKLARDSQGNLYGTTSAGGTGCEDANGCGTVYKLDPAGKERVLRHFSDPGGDGAQPEGGVILTEGGFLYGTTSAGGNTGCTQYRSPVNGCGTVFKVDSKTGKETIITVLQDGQVPAAALTSDWQGNFYSTASGGGSLGDGTLFKIDRNGNERVLHSFGTTADDGSAPSSDLVRDEQGNLYGTTFEGGGLVNGNYNATGTVYKLASNGKENILHIFTGFGVDGSEPVGGLVRDEHGNLYGMTEQGGAAGLGTVFKVEPNGKETVVYSFTGTGGDGAYPIGGGLVKDYEGNLFGVTGYGGTYNKGTVFKLDRSGHETVLHSFGGGEDGAYPASTLQRDEYGNFYGTTVAGGAFGNGTVFKLTREWQ